MANVAAGAMVFGRSFADQLFSPWLTVARIGIWLVLVVYAIGLAWSRRHDYHLYFLLGGIVLFAAVS